jgi:hypothetical protein
MDLTNLFNSPLVQRSQTPITPQPHFAGASYNDITDGSIVQARQCWQDEVLPGNVPVQRGEWVVKMTSGKLNACDNASFLARFAQVYPRAADRTEREPMTTGGSNVA